MSLALLVPEAGHTLGAWQIFTRGMFYAGTLAVCASRPRARRKKIYISQFVWYKQQRCGALSRRGWARFPE